MMLFTERRLWRCYLIVGYRSVSYNAWTFVPVAYPRFSPFEQQIPSFRFYYILLVFFIHIVLSDQLAERLSGVERK